VYGILIVQLIRRVVSFRNPEEKILFLRTTMLACSVENLAGSSQREKTSFMFSSSRVR
jgi:hypothetical protein